MTNLCTTGGVEGLRRDKSLLFSDKHEYMMTINYLRPSFQCSKIVKEMEGKEDDIAFTQG